MSADRDFFRLADDGRALALLDRAASQRDDFDLKVERIKRVLEAADHDANVLVSVVVATLGHLCEAETLSPMQRVVMALAAEQLNRINQQFLFVYAMKNGNPREAIVAVRPLPCNCEECRRERGEA